MRLERAGALKKYMDKLTRKEDGVQKAKDVRFLFSIADSKRFALGTCLSVDRWRQSTLQSKCR